MCCSVQRFPHFQQESVLQGAHREDKKSILSTTETCAIESTCDIKADNSVVATTTNIESIGINSCLTSNMERYLLQSGSSSELSIGLNDTIIRKFNDNIECNSVISSRDSLIRVDYRRQSTVMRDPKKISPKKSNRTM